MRTRLHLPRRAGMLGLCLLVWCMFSATVASATVSGVRVALSTAQAGAASSYSITFTATRGLAGGDQVIVFAPSGTVFPAPPYTCPGCAPDLSAYHLNDNVRNHGVVLDSVSFNADHSTVYVHLAPDWPNYPNDIPPTRSVTLTITGVSNPTHAAGYDLLVATTGDPNQVFSNAYSITPAPAAGVTVFSGSGQTASVLNPFSSTLQAAVVDQYGNVVSGGSQSITFTAPSSGPSGTFAGGSLTDTVRADSSGVATSSTFIAGTQAGMYPVTAAVGSAPPTDFTLTNLAGAATQLSVTAGNGQTAPAGQPFATRLAVTLLDRFGNPVSTAGVQITFTARAADAGGTFTGSGTNREVDVTDDSGVATASAFTANGTLGTYTVQASGPGITATTVALTNVVGPPTQMALDAGDRQSVQVGQVFARPLAVMVTDQYGHPIAGQSVTFAAQAGDAGAGAAFADNATRDTETTNALGIATSAALTAGDRAGPYTVQVTSPGLSPVAFSLINTPGPPAKLISLAGDHQSTPVGGRFAAPLQVRIEDQYGNPVPNANVPVTFTAPPGGPTGTFAATRSTSETDDTDRSAMATSSTITAGTQLGAFTVVASAEGIPAVDFSLGNQLGPATTLSVAGGNEQAISVGNQFLRALQALVTDAYGHPLASQRVTFVAAPGDGARFTGGATSDTEITDRSGVATSAAVVAGHTVRTDAVQATIGDAAPITFSLTSLPGSAARISLGLAPGTIVADGVAATTATAVVTDAYGNALGHERVVFSASAGQDVEAAPSAGDGRYLATVRATERDGSSTITAIDLSAASALRAASTLDQVGSNRFSITRLRINRREGTAAVTVMLPGPGVVTLSGARLRFVRVRVDRARAVVLDISPTPALRRRLGLRRRTRIMLRVRYAPIGGAARSFTKMVTLRKL
ncbi:MAG: hypothetical protein JOZ95_26285 [Solirubrobacterales bacterium]|nr:hypothetical protein [Solirubrobacterales bacterium]